MRSAPSGPVYRIEEPVYQPSMNPVLAEAQRMLIESLEDQARADLDRMKRRRDPPKRMSFDEINARAKVFNIMQQNEARNFFQMKFMMDTQNAGTALKPADLEEFKETINSAMEQIRVNTERQAQENIETITAVGELFKIFIPQSVIPDDFWQNYQAAKQEKEKSDKEALHSIKQIFSERLKQRKMKLQPLEDQNKKMMEDFLKTVHPSLRHFFNV